MGTLGNKVTLTDLRPEELALLLELGERLVSELDLEKVLELVAETACQVVHAETLVVPIIDIDQQTFTYRAASGVHAKIILGQTFPIHEGACGWVMGHQQPLLFGEGASFGIDANARWQPGMASSLLVPLICRGIIAGGLSAMGKQGGSAFNQRDLTVLTLFANQASIAIDNARLFQNVGKEKAIAEQYRTVVHASIDGFWVTDTQGRILEVNESVCKMHGYSRKEFLHMSISDIEADETPEETAAHMRHMIETGHVQFEARHKRKNGTIANVEVSIQHVANLGDRLFAFIRDITHIKKHEAELSRAANYDALTGVPNRVLLADRMNQGIAQTEREQNMMAICYLDLDGFKSINDIMGHEVGDQVLIEVAKRIENTIRGGDTVARLGGDEFVVLLLGLGKGDECVTTLERLLTAIAHPIIVNDKSPSVSASIGVSIYPLDDEDSDTLLRHADQSMYQAKQSGKNRFHIYDPAMGQREKDQNEFQKNIRFALESNQFELFYQPKVNLRTKELVGAEALIRWRHPERGLLSPAEFLHHIENTDLDIKIGEWVIATALAQLNHWRSKDLDIEISINISGFHLESPLFLECLQQQLAHYTDMPVGNLQIEVLETVALKDIAIVREIIEACREIGVGFALDDFGTGYSSLSYLSSLPIDTLKIDQSFVRDMLTDEGDRAIVIGVIALAKAFHRQTVAEGIETEEHYQMLLEMGCEIGQGYGIARPMPASELINWKSNYR